MMGQTKMKCGSSQHEEQLLRKSYNFGSKMVQNEYQK